MNTDNIKINKQSSIEIDGSKVVYFDPWDVTDGKTADVIFITHDHFDHYSPDDINRLKKDSTYLVIPKSMLQQVKSDIDINDDHLIPLEPGDTTEIDDISIEAVPMYNKLKPFHSKSNKFVGYVIDLDGTRYYAMGDTDFTKESGQVSCDVLFIPIGGTYTMNVNGGIKAAKAIHPKVAIPIHYGTIVGNYSDGPEFKQSVEKDGTIQVDLKLG